MAPSRERLLTSERVRGQGMNLYTFSGVKVHSVLRDKLCARASAAPPPPLPPPPRDDPRARRSYQLLWRPRPPTLLTPAKLQHIEANLDVRGAGAGRARARAAR